MVIIQAPYLKNLHPPPSRHAPPSIIFWTVPIKSKNVPTVYRDHPLSLAVETVAVTPPTY